MFFILVQMSLNIVSKVSIDNNSASTLNNGLSPNKQQGITCTNDNQILQRHMSP